MTFGAFISELTQVPPFEPTHAFSRRPDRRAAVRLSRRFRAAAERVYDAWLDPAIAGKWLFATATCPMAAVSIDARVGGAFRFVDRTNGEPIEHIGVYLEIARPRRLAFTLATKSHPQLITRVAAEIVALERGCHLIVAHEDLPGEHVNRVETRWTGILYGLGVILGESSASQGLSASKRSGLPRGPEAQRRAA